MSKERTSTESSNDDQTNEDSDGVFRQEDNAKHEKFASFSDTTLQDIPTEILQCILVKAVVMEVKNMKLAKSVWKEKADLVISRLGSVCSQWSNVLTTDFFQIELHRTLDGIAQETIRMDVEESLIPIDCSYVEGIDTLKDDILLFCRRKTLLNGIPIHSGHNIRIYDRNNMAEVKDVIELTGDHYWKKAACNVSNCIYVLKEKRTFKLQCSSVLRITKDDDQKFSIQSCISDLRCRVGTISVSDEGRIIVLSSPSDGLGPNVVSVYDPNGLMHHEVILSQDVYGFQSIHGCITRKSNANFVLGSAIRVSEQREVELTEIDAYGVIQRQYKSSLEQMSHKSSMSFADASGRIFIHDVHNGIELLDSELNFLELIGPQSNRYGNAYYRCLHFNSQRNEVVGICSVGPNAGLLKIFRFVED